MFKIKNVEDLEIFKNSGLFSSPYIQFVEEYFWQLVTSLTPPDSEPSNYDLTEDGYIVVLQESDNPRSLPEAGLPEGLMITFPGPEFVEKECLSDTFIYRIVFLYSNAYAMTFFLSDIWREDREFQDYLMEWVEDEPLLDYLEGGFNNGC